MDPGSLVLVPSQDPFAGLPVLQLDKNTILDFLQAPQSERPSGQRYLEAPPQNTSHSGEYVEKSLNTISSRLSLDNACPKFGLRPLGGDERHEKRDDSR